MNIQILSSAVLTLETAKKTFNHQFYVSEKQGSISGEIVVSKKTGLRYNVV